MTCTLYSSTPGLTERSHTPRSSTSTRTEEPIRGVPLLREEEVSGWARAVGQYGTRKVSMLFQRFVMEVPKDKAFHRVGVACHG